MRVTVHRERPTLVTKPGRPYFGLCVGGRINASIDKVFVPVPPTEHYLGWMTAAPSSYDEGLQRMLSKWFRAITITGLGEPRTEHVKNMTVLGSYYMVNFNGGLRMGFRQDNGEFSFAIDATTHGHRAYCHVDRFQRVGPATRELFAGLTRIPVSDPVMRFWIEDKFRIGIDQFLGNVSERCRRGARARTVSTDPYRNNVTMN